MAKLIYVMNTSLDGYTEDEHGSFGFGTRDEELNSYINEVTSPVGTFLYGRRMYEAMVFWEADYAAHDLPPYMQPWVKQWQAAEKIVYSTTLAEPRSARTRIERAFDPEAVRQLKAASARDLTISGPTLAAHALRAGLVDEIQMFVWPAVIGGGIRFFPNGVHAELERIEARPFRNGVVAMRYAIRG